MIHQIAICVALGYGGALQNPEVDPAAWERAKTFVAAINRNLTPGFERFAVSLNEPRVTVSTREDNEVSITFPQETQTTIRLTQNRIGAWEVTSAYGSVGWEGRPSRLEDRPANLPGRTIPQGRHLPIVRDLFASAGYHGQFLIEETLDRDDLRLRFHVQRLTKSIPSNQVGYLDIDYETGQLINFDGWDTMPPAEPPDYRLSPDEVEAVMLLELMRRGIAGRLVNLSVVPCAYFRPMQAFYEFPWRFLEDHSTPAERQAHRERREQFVYLASGYNGTQGKRMERSWGHESFCASLDPRTGRIISFQMSRGSLSGNQGPTVTPFPIQGDYRVVLGLRSGIASGSLEPAEAPAAFQGMDFFLKQGTRITLASYAKGANLLRIEGKFYRPDPALRQGIENLLR